MRFVLLACSAVLAAGCTSDEPAACPDPDDPVAADLVCHLDRYLHEAGFDDDQIVVDAAELLGPAGMTTVMNRRGWTSEPATDGLVAVFALGEPALYTSGQRVLYYDDKVTLATFAVNEVIDAAFVGLIEVAVDGTVLSNTVDRLLE
jgi:hypothetical protein